MGDLNFVTKKYTTFIRQLGYTGTGWQHRVQTEFLLYMKVIGWEDISHTLTATAHLPPGLLTNPLRQMEKAWEGHELAKLAVNSLIGLWAIDKNYSHTLRSSTHEADAPVGALKQTFHWEGGCTHDFITSTLLLSRSTCRPLHDLCMCTEAVRIGQVIYELQQSRAVIYEFKTDSVMYKALKRTRPRIETLAFRDLDTLRGEEGPQKKLKTVWYPDSVFLMTACPSDDKVFRVQAVKEKDLMKSNPKLPERRWALSLPLRVWTKLEQDEGERRVLEGGSLLVTGIAGTGKTTYVQGIVERLRADGKVVDIISKTHTASKRAGGVTADHWVRRYVLHGAPRCNVLWIDEISQLDVGLWLHVNQLAARAVQFAAAGGLN